MMSMAGASSVGALPETLSTVVCIMSIEAGANSLGAEIRPAAGSVNTAVVASTAETIFVVASEATVAATNSTVPSSVVEV